MKRMLAAALALVAGAALAEPLAPDALVRDVMLDIQRFIVTDKDLQEGDRAKTIRLIEDKALPHFNHVGMTALAVGVHWRKATPEQKKRLADAFRTLLVRTYAPYSKWLGTAFGHLVCGPDLTPLLNQVLDSNPWQAREKPLTEAYGYLAEKFNALGLMAPIEAKISDQ